MAVLLARLGRGTARNAVAVLLLWGALLVAAAGGAVALAGPTSTSFSIPGQESTTALARITEEFGAGGGAQARVVVQAPPGVPLTTPQGVAALQEAVAALRALPGVAAASDPLDPAAPSVSPDRSTALVTVTYTAGPGEVSASQQEALFAAVQDVRDAGLVAEVTGEAAQEQPHVGGPAEAVGVVLALAVLAVTYGSLVPAGMNLLTAAVGVGVGLLGIAIASGLTELSSTTPTLAAMLGLAVGIDYALFIVTRHRQELLRGRPVHEAVATAVGTAGSAVLVAGLTVVIALAGLAVVGIPFLTQMGLAAAGTVVVAVLVALTLVPAALALLGRRVLPRGSRGGLPVAGPRAEGGLLGRWVDVVTRRRVPALLVAVAALGALALPAATLDTTLVPTAAPGTTQARADALLAGAFGPGAAGPLTVLVEDDAGAARAAAEQVREVAAGLDRVVAVTDAVPSPDGSAALVTVVPATGPADAATEQLVTDLRAALGGLDGVRASVTGATAVSVDVAGTLDRALPVYLLLVVGLALVLLVLVFRSLLVPVVGVLGFLLTVGASLGATVLVFQEGVLADLVSAQGTGPLISLTPVLVIGILFGLAMDYQVFLVSRMHEAHAHGAAPLEAVRGGFRRAAPVVVAAAAIMFAVFAGFVPAGDAAVQSIAFALAVGIVVDAYVVRMVVVPAALALLGERAWALPRWLHRLPVLDVEGAALPPHREVPERELVGAGR